MRSLSRIAQLFALVLAACSSAQAPLAPASPSAGAESEGSADAPLERAKRRSDRERIYGSLRPDVIAVKRIDVARLPVLPAPRPTSRATSFAIRSSAQGAWRLDTGPGLVGRIDAGDFRSYTFSHSRSKLQFSGKDSPWEKNAELEGQAPCGEHRAKAPALDALVHAIRLEGFRDDRLEYESFDGELETSGCRFSARRTSRITVPALVPGLLYLFRRSGTDADHEEIVMVGPPADWLVAAVDPSEREKHRAGAMTIATARIARGGTASIVFRTGWRDIAYFVGLHREPPAWAKADTLAGGEKLGFSIELVWPTDSDSPEGEVLLSRSSLFATSLLDLDPED